MRKMSSHNNGADSANGRRCEAAYGAYGTAAHSLFDSEEGFNSDDLFGQSGSSALVSKFLGNRESRMEEEKTLLFDFERAVPCRPGRPERGCHVYEDTGPEGIDQLEALLDLQQMRQQVRGQPAPPIFYGQAEVSCYRPQAVRGRGADREGYCTHCDKWFRLKTSSYWYHMNYKHGIGAAGRKYPEPEMRSVRGQKEGFCRECRAWIALGTNLRSVRYGWYKHWQKNHSKGKTI